MPNHKIGTPDEWSAARAQLLEREQGLGQLDEEVAKQRMELPWVPVEKEYTFDTEDGKKTLVELFDGRSQLLIYHLMFGPSYEAACPGCTGLADHLDAALVHMNNRDVTLMCISRAPIEKLNAYKQRMGWRFPWPSSFASDFNFDFDFAHTDEEMKTASSQRRSRKRPTGSEDWADSVGTDLASGMAESPGWSVFARENGSVYHTYSRTDFPLRRHDEY